MGIVVGRNHPPWVLRTCKKTIQDNGNAFHFGGVGKYAGESGPVDIDNVTFSVPEPATIALLGLGAFALVRKRR